MNIKFFTQLFRVTIYFLGFLLVSIFPYLITWLSEIYLTSLIALFWNFPLVICNFPLMVCNFPLLFSHSKSIRRSTLITIIIIFYLSIIIVIIVKKSHNNYCSVAVMEFKFFKFVDIDWLFFCVIFTLVYSLRACHMGLTSNHMYIREIWRKKIKKSELGKFILNFPLKHVITSTNIWNRNLICGQLLWHCKV